MQRALLNERDAHAIYQATPLLQYINLRIHDYLRGIDAGGERTVNVRFPDDHRNETLRGKSGVATVKVSEVKEKILPPLDDELAKTVGQFDTLAALRAEISKGLQTRRETENRRALEDAVMEAVLAGHPVEVPEALVLRQVGHALRHRVRLADVAHDGGVRRLEGLEHDAPDFVAEADRVFARQVAALAGRANVPFEVPDGISDISVKLTKVAFGCRTIEALEKRVGAHVLQVAATAAAGAPQH